MPPSTRRITPPAITSWKASSRSRSRSIAAGIDRRHIISIVPPSWGRSIGCGGDGGSTMSLRHTCGRFGARLSAVAALALLCGCIGNRDVPAAEPSFYRSLATKDAEVDASMAASMISGYRTNNGLTPVTIDPELMKLAEAQAQAMASRDPLKGGGYRARTAAENVGAGYHTLAQAFSGWRDSPSHRDNMLLKGATRMGIAAAYSPKSKYKVFWALILAEPDERRS